VLAFSMISSDSRRKKRKTSSDTWYVLPTSASISTSALTEHLQVAYARCHLDWAKKNLETWTEAKDEVDKIEVR